MRTEPFSAEEARERSRQRKQRAKGGDLNFSLTIKRLYRIIEAHSAKGDTSLVFRAPSFVLDGCIADPIILAKQIKVRLSDLGYKVKRDQDVLSISWK